LLCSNKKIVCKYLFAVVCYKLSWKRCVFSLLTEGDKDYTATQDCTGVLRERRGTTYSHHYPRFVLNTVTIKLRWIVRLKSIHKSRSQVVSMCCTDINLLLFDCETRNSAYI